MKIFCTLPKAYFLRILFLLFSGFLFAAINILPARAIATGGVGAYPAHPDPAIKYSDSWFIYTLDLGESKDDVVLVVNTTQEEKTVKLYPVDGTSSNLGNFALEKESDSRDGIGAWITLSEAQLTLRPGESREVPFTIAIPSDADVGEHTGGIIVQKIVPGQALGSGGAAIQTRIGVRVYETVPGAIVRDIAVKDFSVRQKKNPDGGKFLKISLVAQNRGNVSVTPEAAIKISGWGKKEYFARSKFRDGFVLDMKDFTDFFRTEELVREWQLLRGKEVSTYWEWAYPAFGKFVFQPELRYTENEAQKIVRGPKVTLWIFPWKELLIIFVLIAIIIFFSFLRKMVFRSGGWKKYTVKKGEHLEGVAKKFGVSWKKLARVNRLKSPFIRAGQTLLVPNRAQKKSLGKH